MPRFRSGHHHYVSVTDIEPSAHALSEEFIGKGRLSLEATEYQAAGKFGCSCGSQERLLSFSRCSGVSTLLRSPKSFYIAPVSRFKCMLRYVHHLDPMISLDNVAPPCLRSELCRSGCYRALTKGGLTGLRVQAGPKIQRRSLAESLCSSRARNCL